VSGQNSDSQDDLRIELLEVRLAHNSVKDYLLSNHIKSGPSAQFQLEAQLAHSFISACCLNYFLQFRSELDTEMLQEFPLAHYSAQFWTEHYKHSGTSNKDFLDQQVLHLLTSTEKYEACWRLYNPDARSQRLKGQRGSGTALPALYYVSVTGLSRMIEPLISQGADSNEQVFGSEFGVALAAAAYSGHEDVVQNLLDAGAKPDGHGLGWDGAHGSPIASAAAQGHTTIVAQLLSAGADIDIRGEDGQGSALYHAVAHRHRETAKMLLNHGANADAAWAGMSGGTSAASVAARQGDGELLCLLLPKIHEYSAGRVLDQIARAGNRELFESLLQIERCRDMALQYAARGGWSDLVETLLNENSEGDKESRTTTAFCQAAASGSLETIQILYERNPETKTTDELGEAVEVSAQYGHTLVVKYLMDRGANSESGGCRSAMVKAAKHGHLSTVQVLLTAGVSPDSEYQISWNKELQSCLWAAVDQEHIEIVRLLLSAGAHPSTQYSRASALCVSIEKGNEKLFNMLLERKASTSVTPVSWAQYDTLALPVHYAASVGNNSILRKMLDQGLDVDEVLLEDGWTALFHAAKTGNKEVVRLLINEYGADAHRQANKGTFAIQTAAYHNHATCIAVFLDAGLDINVQDNAGRTSLHWAAQEGSIDAVRILLERGADVFIEEKNRFMLAEDIAREKAMKMVEHQKSQFHREKPGDENYQLILEMLVEKASEVSTSTEEAHLSS
jgi:ankyrin repeat protein